MAKIVAKLTTVQSHLILKSAISLSLTNHISGAVVLICKFDFATTSNLQHI